MIPAPRRHAAGAFERHVLEAIELNRQRAPAYALASGGASLRICAGLIRRERMLLPLARWFDRRATSYDRAGIPLLEDLFVSMELTPALVTRMVVPAPRLPPPRSHTVRRPLRRAFSAGGFAAARLEVERQIGALEPDAGSWCMLRHLLESMRRLCVCAGIHEELAAQAGLSSPAGIHRALWRLHLFGVGSAARLDRLALPVQRAGVPILCRDLPSVEAWPPGGQGGRLNRVRGDR